MSNMSKLKERRAKNRFRRAALRLRKEMDPYADKAETSEGMMAMLLVAGIAQFVADGIESEEYLAKTIQLASEISKIPQSAFKAYAEFIMAMHTGHQMSLRTSPFVGDDDE
jgi:hypothetical protein